MKKTGKNLVMIVKDHAIVAGIVAAVTVATTAIVALVVNSNKKQQAEIEILPTTEE